MKHETFFKLARDLDNHSIHLTRCTNVDAMSYFLKSHQDYAKNVTISKVPEYFVKKKEDGDSKNGRYYFVTTKLDDVYGEIANFEVRWAETNPLRYHVGKESTRLMAENIEVGIGFSERTHIKVNGHDAYYIFGGRKEAKKGRIYLTNYVLVNFCCPASKRAFMAKFAVFADNFPNMQEHVKGIVDGIICH